MESIDTNRRFQIDGHELIAPSLAPGLYLVATPIGNLDDITLRALKVLAGADLIACEDKRISVRLLERYGIRSVLQTYHEHNADVAGPLIVKRLGQGHSVALISDAGTPLISDPGYRLVEAARESNSSVIAVPGPSALLAALVSSGLPTDSFMFAGFLPAKASARERRLRQLSSVSSSLIFYESPNRLIKCLADMGSIFGVDHRGVVCRELTKRFEEVQSGTLAELRDEFDQRPSVKGEIAIVLAPPEPVLHAPKDIDHLLVEAAQRMSASKAAGEVAKHTGQSRAQLYQRLMELKREQK